MDDLKGKKWILLGDEDGVTAEVMGDAFAHSGAEIGFSITESFG